MRFAIIFVGVFVLIVFLLGMIAIVKNSGDISREEERLELEAMLAEASTNKKE